MIIIALREGVGGAHTIVLRYLVMARRGVSSFLLAFSLALILHCDTSNVSAGMEEEPHTLRLLVLVPFPDPRPSAGWDRGLELLPAARLARDHINNSTDLLQGYRLELIEASSDGCGVSTISTALVSFVRHAATRINSMDSVIGILGLACSSVTAIISPLAGHTKLDYIQVAMANSPIFSLSKEKYPHLWRVLPTSLIYSNVTIALLDQFNWTRVATIYDGNGVFFSSTANVFVDALESSGKTNVLESTIEGIDNLYIDSVLSQIRTTGARIVFLSMSEAQAATILCKAAELRLIWPGYAWIIPARATIEEFLSDSPCSKPQLLTALENAFLFRFQLQQYDNGTVLVSNITYEEYRSQYLHKLQELMSEKQYLQYNNSFSGTPTLFANPMYDEVFAFALALNYSLPELKSRNLSLENFTFNRSEITDLIESHFTDVSFTGATGEINFDKDGEGLLPILVYQVQNSTVVRIGEYNSVKHNLTLQNVDLSSIPSDEIETRHQHLPITISLVVLTAAGITILVTSVVLLLVLCYSQTKEIKAISPILSIIIFIGCYMQCYAALFRTIVHGYTIPLLAYKTLCCIEIWCGSTGINLILATVLLKLARIYRIFTHFGKLGKFWSDISLFCLSLLICLPPNIYLALWFGIDTPRVKFTNSTITDVVPPFIELSRECSSNYFDIWLTIAFMPTIVLLFIVVIFALLTRKIDRDNFKDTKKVTAYVATIFITITVILPTWKILDLIRLDNYAHLVLCTGFVAVALFTIAILFLPKVGPLLKGSFLSVIESRSYTLPTLARSETKQTLKLVNF